MGKRFASVSEMVQSTAGEAFADRYSRATANRSVSRVLFGLRNAQGLTQEELASKMGITQSAVSRLEHSDNDKVRVDEIAQYAAALGLKVSVNIHPERNTAEWAGARIDLLPVLAVEAQGLDAVEAGPVAVAKDRAQVVVEALVLAQGHLGAHAIIILVLSLA